MKNIPTFSILIPTYKGSTVIRETLESILNQTYQDFEIIISEDCSRDGIKDVIDSYGDGRIKYFENSTNVGYPTNLEFARAHATGKYLYLVGQDDLVAKDALKNTLNAFELSPDIGAVTRPYYWFNSNEFRPVRKKKTLEKGQDTVLTMDSNPTDIITMFSTLDQLTGLSFRSDFFDIPFHSDIFPCHVYPFASIFKKHPVVFLKDYNVAVRISTSQTRHVSSIYNVSPLLSWVELFKSVYPEPEWKGFREHMIKNFVANNYVGLVQIRNYAKFKYLIREIIYLIKYRPSNLFSVYFWFFAFGTIIIPPFILIGLVDWYKDSVNHAIIGGINFNYEPKRTN
ncbi:MAG: Glycosyl transferase, group 2 family [candidate division WWE3 bacterium GW2011_GWF1_42_14]|uniref:Glycosyl transferase, group 2 family n=2 Tax=Katanobacteria TaxID=422282 RepID=A0A0G1BPN1_UNCKA|nr:MAG: Glycosyl transferase, group 2 family [candidate division WWE3 bacterium GW2011_GWA1_42_12]KKS35201.1 MAG: Glycosyl transferase, group 2 family [candidate division WWE3 bacterium GW2011_GWD1_42_14]KKS39448.1 MAG: Glycosyl transferase, group 2 family [candidate division WWE3 bacterium GW2011_GWF1_42_14]KKS40891.1 MAG: Glycosyl transferase, group 2 family [candidate division WWE3 bacterium GW2011_GWE1_42_16]KKS67287.1 MAG: Glycosyl transferase, group 2 family [candidate division WWE3 bacte